MLWKLLSLNIYEDNHTYRHSKDKQNTLILIQNKKYCKKYDMRFVVIILDVTNTETTLMVCIN